MPQSAQLDSASDFSRKGRQHAPPQPAVPRFHVEEAARAYQGDTREALGDAVPFTLRQIDLFALIAPTVQVTPFTITWVDLSLVESQHRPALRRHQMLADESGVGPTMSSAFDESLTFSHGRSVQRSSLQLRSGEGTSDRDRPSAEPQVDRLDSQGRATERTSLGAAKAPSRTREKTAFRGGARGALCRQYEADRARQTRACPRTCTAPGKGRDDQLRSLERQ